MPGTAVEPGATGLRPGGLRDPIPPGLGRMQPFCEALAGWAFVWHSRLKVRGRGHVPLSGPVILAANHRSMLDIPLLVLASPRRVYFMAKSGLFERPFLAWSFHELGGFPVRRDLADMRALETARAILERGDALGIYPEGTRSRSGEMLPFLGGAAWLALRTGAPIVPCGMAGTAGPLPIDHRPSETWRSVLRSLSRRRVTIRFGPAIPVDPEPSPRARRERTPEVTTRLMAAIAELTG